MENLFHVIPGLHFVDIEAIVGFDVDRALCYLYSLKSVAFRYFLGMVINFQSEKYCTYILSICHIHFLQYWYVHGGFILQPSNFNHLRNN